MLPISHIYVLNNILEDFFEQSPITRHVARSLLALSEVCNKLGKGRRRSALPSLFSAFSPSWKSLSYTPSHTRHLLSPRQPLFFQSNERTSEIYFTSPRQPPFRVTRKSAPRRGEKEAQLATLSIPPSAARSPPLVTPCHPADSSMNRTVRSIKQLPEG